MSKNFSSYINKVLRLVLVNIMVSIFLTIFYFFPGLVVQNYGYLNLYIMLYSVFQFIIIFFAFYSITFLLKNNSWLINKNVLKLFFVVNIFITVSLWAMDLKYNKSWSILYNVSSGSTATLTHALSIIPEKFLDLKIETLLFGFAENIFKTVVVFIGLRKHGIEDSNEEAPQQKKSFYEQN